jgi:hypothetical protein
MTIAAPQHEEGQQRHAAAASVLAEKFDFRGTPAG